MRAVLLTLLLALPAPALACPSAAKCVTPGGDGLNRGGAGKWLSAPKRPPPVEIGQVLEPGKYRILLNTAYYGLPPVADGWVYYRIEHDIYRVDRHSLKVLARATDEANRAF